MAETYTGDCTSYTSTFGACASRVDSLRQVCTSSYGSLTQWPGPCECSYYAEDLMCFDEQALCASQVWSQVPQWFRDGVTSCLAKDAKYTIRAELGTFEVPFTVAGLAGSIASTASATAAPGSSFGSVGVASATSGARTESSAVVSKAVAGSNLSTGAIAGISIGVVAIFLLLLLVSLLMFRRRITAREGMEGKLELDGSRSEVHEVDARASEVHEMSQQTWSPELPGCASFTAELSSSVSAPAELPGHRTSGFWRSTRNSIDARPGG